MSSVCAFAVPLASRVSLSLVGHERDSIHSCKYTVQVCFTVEYVHRSPTSIDMIVMFSKR